MTVDLVNCLEHSTSLIALDASDMDWFNANGKKSASTHDGTGGPRPRLASVALLLRRRQSKVEMLMIKRAINPRDKWSGHIGLPGGRQEARETALQAAVRECEEEVGISVESGRFAVLGRLKDSRTGTSRDAYTVASFVFVQLEADVDLPLKIQSEEVAYAWWIDTAIFFPTANLGEIGLPVTGMVKIAKRQPWKALLGVFGAETAFFPCFFLPPPPIHQGHPSPAAFGTLRPSSSSTASTVNVDPRDPDTFVLWGLTFGIVQYLALAAGGGTFAYQKPPYFRFHSLVPDFLVHVFYRLIGWNRAITSLVTSLRIRQ